MHCVNPESGPAKPWTEPAVATLLEANDGSERMHQFCVYTLISHVYSA